MGSQTTVPPGGEMVNACTSLKMLELQREIVTVWKKVSNKEKIQIGRVQFMGVLIGGE